MTKQIIRVSAFGQLNAAASLRAEFIGDLTWPAFLSATPNGMVHLSISISSGLLNHQESQIQK